MRALRQIVFVWLLGLPAYGWEFNYTVTINSQSPRYQLPSEDLTQVQGGGQNNVRYHLFGFTAQFTGLYTFVSLASWDNFVVLYRTAFNPNTPLVNAVVANNNNPTVGTAGFTAVLTGGEQYFVVTSPASNGSGTFVAANQITGVPEPATWATLAAGLCAVWMAHKNKRIPR